MLTLSRLMPVCLLLFNLNAKAQVSNQSENDTNPKTFAEIYSLTEKALGIDQELVIGEMYEDHYRGAIRHPFLLEDKFTNGSIIFKNKTYNNLNLKYDIYDQKVIVDYYYNQTQLRFCLQNEFLDQFVIYDKIFKKIKLDGKDEAIYQVIENENLTCLYYWFRVRTESDHLLPKISYEFSPEKRKRYLMVRGELSSFRSNASFIKSFPKNIRKPIKKKIKSSKLFVASANDTQMQNLLDFCNSLL